MKRNTKRNTSNQEESSLLAEWISPAYLDEKKKKTLKQNFKHAKPFPHLELPQFFLEEKIVEILRALMQVRFYEKDADLFHFYQTSDIASIPDETLQSFRSLLCSQAFLSFMHELTGLSFKNNAVDLHGSLFSDTDHLLCHDDQLEGRNIAFLLYLSNLTTKDGGSLNLLDKKQQKIKQLVPKCNTFTFFHVSPLSFHEVAEVVTNTQRIALGGWLHDQ